MNHWTKHALACLAGVLLTAIVAGAFVYHTMWSRYGAAQEALEARIERYGGLVQAKVEVDGRLETVRNARQILLNVGPDTIANDLLQQLRQLITTSECSLVSSQAALEASPGTVFDRARLSVTVSGEWSKLVGLVASIQNRQPPFWVQSATIMRDISAGGPAAQTGRLVLQLEAPVKVRNQDTQP